MGRQWDDWRCYRCGKWRAARMARRMLTTPSGMSVAVCALCVKSSEGQDSKWHGTVS